MTNQVESEPQLPEICYARISTGFFVFLGLVAIGAAITLLIIK